jgi:hypothetical protein
VLAGYRLVEESAVESRHDGDEREDVAMDGEDVAEQPRKTA